jgi:hypothetical protein
MALNEPNQVPLDKVYIWWTNDQNNIHLTCDDRRIVDDGGRHKGLNIAINRRRHPRTFRWLALLLRSEGKRSPNIDDEEST